MPKAYQPEEAQETAAAQSEAAYFAAADQLKSQRATTDWPEVVNRAAAADAFNVAGGLQPNSQPSLTKLMREQKTSLRPHIKTGNTSSQIISLKT